VARPGRRERTGAATTSRSVTTIARFGPCLFGADGKGVPLVVPSTQTLGNFNSGAAFPWIPWDQVEESRQVGERFVQVAPYPRLRTCRNSRCAVESNNCGTALNSVSKQALSTIKVVNVVETVAKRSSKFNKGDF